MPVGGSGWVVGGRAGERGGAAALPTHLFIIPRVPTRSSSSCALLVGEGALISLGSAPKAAQCLETAADTILGHGEAQLDVEAVYRSLECDANAVEQEAPPTHQHTTHILHL